MKFVLMSALLCLAAGTAMAGTDGTELAIQEMVDVWNLYSLCWGEDVLIEYIKEVKKAVKECGLEDTNEVNTRRRRQAPTPQEVVQFVMKAKKFQNINEEKWAGLKCALRKLDAIDENDDIKIEAIKKSWTSGEHGEKDEEFTTMMVNGSQDCYDVSQSWPQSMLDRNEWLQKYGRFTIFFRCQKAVQEKGCYADRIKTIQDAMSGSLDDVDHEEYGFPANKYDAAAMAMRVKVETMSPANAFLHEFLFAKAIFL